MYIHIGGGGAGGGHTMAGFKPVQVLPFTGFTGTKVHMLTQTPHAALVLGPVRRSLWHLHYSDWQQSDEVMNLLALLAQSTNTDT